MNETTNPAPPLTDGVEDKDTAAPTPGGHEEHAPERPGDSRTQTTADDDAPPEAEEPLAALEAENAALKDRLLRAMADLENLRTRAERERTEAARYAAAGFARDLLAVADNLARALETASGGDPSAQDKTALETLLSGVELTERELAKAFERHHVRRIEALGAKFDPNHHQAMFKLPSADATPGTVVQVVQTGYVMGERVLRPAMVGVATAETPPSDPPKTDAPERKSDPSRPASQG